MTASTSCGGVTPVGSARLRALGTSHRVVTTDPGALDRAVALVRAHLVDLDHAASRFRADSEVSRLARTTPGRPATAVVSALLERHLRAALAVARSTDGLVDPTVGRALAAEGYDADLDVVRTRTARLGTAGVVPGWRSVRLDGGLVTVPGGTLLDLGATAKALAADELAALLAADLGVGFLVDLGGDVATAGEVPAGGWQVGVDAGEGPPGRTVQVVGLTGQALATSSSRRRRWATDHGPRHHVIDPRTGRSAVTPWAQVTCSAATALDANAASTAALVLGHDAPAWLQRRGVAARLHGVDGSVVLTGGWPTDTASPNAAGAGVAGVAA